MQDLLEAFFTSLAELIDVNFCWKLKYGLKWVVQRHPKNRFNVRTCSGSYPNLSPTGSSDYHFFSESTIFSAFPSIQAYFLIVPEK